MNILVADAIDTHSLTKLKKHGHEVDIKSDVTADELVNIIDRYDAVLLRSRTKITRAVIDKATKLKYIGRVGTGLDNIDISAADEKKIKVLNAPGANSTAVAEYTIGLILSLLRHLPQAHSTTRHGGWEKKSLKGEEIAGKTVGIVGYGNIGQKVARLAEAFGATVVTFDRHDDTDKLHELFKNSDIITLHAALVPETKGMINASLLGLMKKTAYIINCARAGLVVEDDLFTALHNNKIAGAALDVFWEEPLPKDSKWRHIDNVILTPHIAGQTFGAGSRAADIIVEKILADYEQNH